MKFFVNSSNRYYIDSSKEYKVFSDKTKKYEKLKFKQVDDSIKNSNKIYNNLLLFPVSDINNLWHLILYMYVTYKYIKNNSLDIDVVYPIIVYKKYMDRIKLNNLLYKDLIFKGLNFNYSKFEEIREIFKQGKYININNLYVSNELINFRSDKLIFNFKNKILNNFGVDMNNKKENKKVTFILRKGIRSISNIDYVKNKLKDFNINYVYLENYSIKEQLKLISNSDVLIGAHGSGLTWSIFMRPKSMLIELFPSEHMNDNYVILCNITNINYVKLCATGEKYGDHIAFGWKNANIILSDKDIDFIKNKIK